MSQLQKVAFVNVSNFPYANREANTLLARGVQSSVPATTLTTVVTLVANGVRFVTKVICSGQENAKWELYIDSVIVATKRGAYTTEFDFLATPYRIDDGSAMDVKVTHAGTSADFDASIVGFDKVP